MDTVLKQRLTGAVVLVALAFIFLPMLVKEPPRASSVDNVSLDIPKPPELANQPTQELPLVATPQDTSLSANQNPPLAQSSTGSDVYAVNWGAYSSEADANAMARRLLDAHFPATVEKSAQEDHVVWRVRIGPYADQAQAQAVRIRASNSIPGIITEVIAIAQSPTPAREQPKAEEIAQNTTPTPLAASPVVTNPTPTTTKSDHHSNPSAAQAFSASGFVVQVAAFSHKSDAVALRDRLKSQGFTAFIQSVKTEKGVLNRVRVGPIIQQAKAEQVKARLAETVGITGMITPFP